jgi:hypothetical protein
MSKKGPTVKFPIFTCTGDGEYYPINPKKYTVEVSAQKLANDMVDIICSETEFCRYGMGEGVDFEDQLNSYKAFVSEEDLRKFATKHKDKELLAELEDEDDY